MVLFVWWLCLWDGIWCGCVKVVNWVGGDVYGFGDVVLRGVDGLLELVYCCCVYDDWWVVKCGWFLGWNCWCCWWIWLILSVIVFDYVWIILWCGISCWYCGCWIGGLIFDFCEELFGCEYVG